MTKKLCLILLVFMLAMWPVYGQAMDASLLEKLSSSQGVEKVDILNQLAESLIEANPDQALNYAKEAEALALNIKDTKGEIRALIHSGYALYQKSSYNESIETFQKAYDKASQNKDLSGQAFARNGFGMIWSALSEYSKALDDYENALKLFEQGNDAQGVAYALNNMGTVYMSMGAYDKALNLYLEALRKNETLGNKEEIAVLYNNIGSANQNQKNFDPAFEYYSKALDTFEELKNDNGISDTLINMGGLFRDFGLPEESQGFYTKALEHAQKMNSKPRMATALSQLGFLHELKKEFPEALKLYTQVLEYGQELNDREKIINAYNNIGTVNHKMGNFDEALDNHIQAFEVSKEITYEDGLRSSMRNIANDYQAMNDFRNANHYYILYNQLREALNEREQSRQFANAQTLYETEKKNQQIEEQRADIAEKERRAAILVGVILITVVVLVGVDLLALQISKERKKSEKLLLNILPKKVADELKKAGKTTPERFGDVTVLFSDFVNFTDTSSKLDPSQVIGELNEIFTLFDGIMEKHHCERIKTIGDAYFAVCGMPVENKDHAFNIAKAAHEMVEVLQQRNKDAEIQWKVRVGIHSGPVVGGVVGVKKYIYDVFGDTVNMASRMESNSAPMRINVSEQTYQLLGPHFKFEEREPAEVKGKGLCKMFFLKHQIDEIEMSYPTE